MITKVEEYALKVHDAIIDTEKMGEFADGMPAIVTPRNGNDYPNMAMIAAHGWDKLGWVVLGDFGDVVTIEFRNQVLQTANGDTYRYSGPLSHTTTTTTASTDPDWKLVTSHNEFTNKTALLASGDLLVGKSIKLTSGEDRGDFDWVNSFFHPDTGNAYSGIYIDHPNVAGGWARSDYSTLKPEFFGNTSNSNEDHYEALQSAFAVGKGYTISLHPNRVYQSSGTNLMQDYQTLKLNGARIKYIASGAVKNLQPVTGCRVSGGIIECAGVDMVNPDGTNAASNGQYQTPVQIGDYSTLTKYKNIHISNLKIVSNRSNGNGIFVTSACRNIKIDNIIFPDSAFLSRPILIHWGSEGGALPPAGGGTGGGTYHPRNISIKNIEVGKLTFDDPSRKLGNSGDIAAVFISASSNITVKNVIFDEASGEGALIKIYGGDYGFHFAINDDERERQFGKIDIKTVEGKAKFGIYCSMQDGGQDHNQNHTAFPVKVWDGQIDIKGLDYTPLDDSTGIVTGARIFNSKNVTISKSTIRRAFYGLYLADGNWENIEINNIKIIDSKYNAIAATAEKETYTGSGVLNTRSTNLRLLNNTIKGSNQNNSGNTSDVTIRYIDNVVIDNNTFDSPNVLKHVAVTGDFAASTYPVPTAPTEVKIINNTSKGIMSTGVCYQLGVSAWDKNVSLFANNSKKSSDAKLASGQFFTPYRSSYNHISGEIIHELTAYNPPSHGVWNKGSICWRVNPAVNQYMGWVCVLGTNDEGGVDGGTWATLPIIPI